MMVHLCLLLALAFANPQPDGTAGRAQDPTAEFNPALVDINELDVAVEVKRHPARDPNDWEFASRLEKLILARFEGAGIHTFASTADAATQTPPGGRGGVDPNAVRLQRADLPVLRTAVDVVFVGRDVAAVFYMHTSLVRLVCLEGRDGPSFQAMVWSAGPAVESVRSSRWQDEVQKVVLEHVDSFIAARKAAASHDGKARRAPSTPALLGSAANAAPQSYVASRNGSVFHRPDCRWAQNIAERNRVVYNSREEAEQDGKRPCKTCNP